MGHIHSLQNWSFTIWYLNDTRKRCKWWIKLYACLFVWFVWIVWNNFIHISNLSIESFSCWLFSIECCAGNFHTNNSDSSACLFLRTDLLQVFRNTVRLCLLRLKVSFFRFRFHLFVVPFEFFVFLFLWNLCYSHIILLCTGFGHISVVNRSQNMHKNSWK